MTTRTMPTRPQLAPDPAAGRDATPDAVDPQAGSVCLAPRPLPATHRRGQVHAELGLRGVLDQAAVMQLAPRLSEAVDSGATWLTVDLGEVVHVDGPAVRSLLMHSRRLHDRGAGLCLSRPRRDVRWALRFSGAGHLLAT